MDDKEAFSGRSVRMRRCSSVVEVLALLLLICGSTIARFLFFAGPRRIAIISDEVLYYDVARNIFKGAGLAFRGFTSLFPKCLYSVVLAPFFKISDGSHRVHAILLFNSAALSSSAGFIWLTVRRLGLTAPLRLLCIAVFLMFPDMIFAGTFMAENIYWPLFFCAVWLWLENESVPCFWRAVLLGVTCYAGYLAKEAFSGLIVAIIALGAVHTIRIALGKELPVVRSRFIKVWCFAVFCLVLAVAHFIFEHFVFAGMGGYAQFHLSHFSTWPKIRHILFGWGHYLAGCGLEVLFLPLLAPLALWGRVQGETRRLYALAAITLLCISGGVAVSIVPLEIPVPHLHLRYAGPVLALMTAICISALDKADDASVVKIALPFVALIAVSMPFLQSWPPPGSAVDNFIHRTMPALIVGSSPWGKAVAFLPLAVAAFAFWRCLRLVGTAVWVISLLFLFANVQLNEGRFVKMLWSEEAHNVLEAKRMNQWFMDNVPGNTEILFVPIRISSGGSYLFDVYFDKWATVSAANKSDIASAANKELCADCIWKGGKWTADPVVLPRIDYLIVENVRSQAQQIVPRQASFIADASGAVFSVYRNNKPKLVPFVKAVVFEGKPMKIRFMPETEDAFSQVVPCRLGTGDENGFPLPEEADMPFKCPTTCNATNVLVSILLHAEEKTELKVLGPNLEKLWSGTINGDCRVAFKHAIRNDYIRFLIRKKNAQVVKIREISLRTQQ